MDHFTEGFQGMVQGFRVVLPVVQDLGDLQNHVIGVPAPADGFLFCPVPVCDHEHKGHPVRMGQGFHGKIQPVADGFLKVPVPDFHPFRHRFVAAVHPQGVPLGVDFIEQPAQQLFRLLPRHLAVPLVHKHIPGILGAVPRFSRDHLEHRISGRYIPVEVQRLPSRIVHN